LVGSQPLTFTSSGRIALTSSNEITAIASGPAARTLSICDEKFLVAGANSSLATTVAPAASIAIFAFSYRPVPYGS